MKMGLRNIIQLFLAAIGAFLASFQPALAQTGSTAQATPPLHVKEDTRPPAGFVRPPLHFKPDATTSTPTGISPAKLRTFYGFDQIQNQGAGQTIAIIDAYDNPNIAKDLVVFSNQFGLPAPIQCGTTSLNNPILTGGCFAKIYTGSRLPKADQGWALEIALDVQWAHAVAPGANILLVEAASNSMNDLMAAVDRAVQLGASVVSMSWGGREFQGETAYDSHFNKPGVTFFASSGDSGTGAEYPAVSPYVISVGGTTAKFKDSLGTYDSEIAWSGSGGGLSLYEPLGQGQNCLIGTTTDLCGNKRGNPDVAYIGDPNTGFAIYDSYGYQGRKGWFQVGGTSAGAPQWAAFFAIVNAQRKTAGQPLLTGLKPVYDAAALLYGDKYHDITSGNNGTCLTLCNAAPGYDLVTGLGSPIAPSLVSALAIEP